MSEFNGVMMQYFHWYNEPDGSLWNQLAENAADLAKVGVTSVWLPPAYKGTAGGYDVGYGVYDIFDLGEFDQKGSVRTKYGTKEEYINAIKVAKAAGIGSYADIVLNHKLGGTPIIVMRRSETCRRSKLGHTLLFPDEMANTLAWSGTGGISMLLTTMPMNPMLMLFTCLKIKNLMIR